MRSMVEGARVPRGDGICHGVQLNKTVSRPAAAPPPPLAVPLPRFAWEDYFTRLP